ncbi:molybdenum cofactor biosynthesis protein MoaE [Candidatus Poribacteria bacterium]|nr:molybdenum cofactor biosynthesis protein MoaE [Candidatus Poribacteria bacterium]MYB64603.1 molybdenum cofactor biosynthesis protein MoaE [Candidatus Poribacteria bacterium]MYF57011.1 molybdenum cofactor biosynthesis protein MoaE [Candidatus Poribacteria bacterium]MYI93787.1 molybdenum cofactor biosynthesis protein MoaE [Candidatus Poribacteria bacterium]
MFKITDEIITETQVREVVESPEAGAVVLFLGTVRNNTDGRQVKHLEYDAYTPMAERKMAEIGQEILEKWGIKHVAIIHRVGKLEIGEVSVAVGVASPHRKNGFEACKYAMDRLKQIVPIWKREVWLDGDAEWVKPDAVYFDRIRS